MLVQVHRNTAIAKHTPKDVVNLLETGHKAGLVFNSHKIQFAQETVEFTRLEASMDRVRPARRFLECIRMFPRPETIPEARAFFGMINHSPCHQSWNC